MNGNLRTRQNFCIHIYRSAAAQPANRRPRGSWLPEVLLEVSAFLYIQQRVQISFDRAWQYYEGPLSVCQATGWVRARLFHEWIPIQNTWIVWIVRRQRIVACYSLDHLLEREPTRTKCLYAVCGRDKVPNRSKRTFAWFRIRLHLQQESRASIDAPDPFWKRRRADLWKDLVLNPVFSNPGCHWEVARRQWKLRPSPFVEGKVCSDS